MKKIVSYWRNSLADADRLELDITKLSLKQEIVWSDVESGKLPERIVDTYFSKKRYKDEDLVEILLCPVIAYPKKVHGTDKVNLKNALVPMWVPAILNKEGYLSVNIDAFAWIPRDYLEPCSSKGTPIGSIEDLDSFLSENEMPKESWSDFWRYVLNMFKFVTNQNLQEFEHEDYGTSKTGLVFIDTIVQGASIWISKLYNHILQEGKIPLLLQKYSSLKETEAIPCLGKTESIPISAEHTGQMSNKYYVANSQREAIHHFFTLGDGEILAINGPPGTGKTTLLQSIIASKWVKAAYNKTRPPIIVVSSANNQAVTNVIESFGKIKEEPNPLEGRWLPEIHSYGLYLVSGSKKEELKKKKNQDLQVLFSSSEDNLRNGFPNKIENKEYLEKAEVFFLNKCKAYASYEFSSLKDAVFFLRQELIKTVDQVKDAITKYLYFFRIGEEHKEKYPEGIEQTILNKKQKIIQINDDIKQLEEFQRSLEIKWVQYLHDEPWWYSFFSFIPYFRRKKKLRDKLFFLSQNVKAVDEESFKEFFDSRRKSLKEELNNAEKKLGVFQRELHKFTEAKDQLDLCCKSMGLEGLENDKTLLDKLDLTYRYKAFKLATHYWEGKWLAEMQVNITTNYKESLESKWLRYAKLTPCFVSTLYMIPSFFGAKEDNPMYEFIDLLIIDEAGQVRPELAGASFALAKKALVVGDTLQIEPIWEIPKQIDIANIIKSGLAISKEEAKESIFNKGLAASNGSVMQLGQRASKYQKYDDMKGMYLIEHRRCVPEIIAFCNELAYKGRLEPKRESIQDFPLPHMGYIDIKGKMVNEKGSNYNLKEAEIIASWIFDNQDKLLELYSNNEKVKDIGDIVGIVTPFTKQKEKINKELKNKGVRNLTVGTVHALQGAEKPIVIFSPVYDSSVNTSVYFFDRGINMLNVAVSRAQDSFLVFGDLGIFDKNSSSSSGTLAKYLFADKKNEIKIEDLITL